MRASTVHVLLAFLLACASAQKIVPTTSSSSFPGCALSCTTLLNAQDICYPPNAAQSTQLTYDNCFCQSSLLSSLYSTSDSVCASECTLATDRQVLRAWFTTFCQQVAAGVDPVSASTATPTTLVTSTIGATSTDATPTVTATNPAQSASSGQGSSWIDTHWKWVLMLGILAVGLGGLAWLAVWLKKRHRRKVEAREVAASGFSKPNEKRPDVARQATPDLWGPHQIMHATNGWKYTHDQDGLPSEGVPGSSTEKENRKPKAERSSKPRESDRIKVAEVQRSAIPVKSTSSRPRPAELDANARAIGMEDRKNKKKRERERERHRDKEIERGLQGKRGKSVRRDRESQKT